MFQLLYSNDVEVKSLEDRGTIAGMDFQAAQPSVAPTVPRFASLVVVNLARQR